MKLSRSQISFSVILVVVFCLSAGLVVGKILRSNDEPTSAASSNISVANNDQTVSHDQSNGEIIIEQTSTVTVRNTEANYGYTLSAKIGQNTLTGASVTIGSGSSLLCSLDDPCTLTAENQAILETTANAATEADGDTTTWVITITVPAEAAMSDYIIDIEYQEEAPTLGMVDPAYPKQYFSRDHCNELAPGSMKTLMDSRDGTYYRVKKMSDGNCWMVDNLAYDINSAPAKGKPTYNPTSALISDPIVGVDTQAQYAQNNNIEGQGQIPNNGNPKASYLYNWCAAMGDTSANCAASKNATDFQTVQNGIVISGTATSQPEVQGICPLPFRLPKGGPESSPASVSSSTANEFVKLDIAMGGLGINRNLANTYPNFTGTTADQKDWLGVLSGDYSWALFNQGSNGNWWSSTAIGTEMAYNMNLDSRDQYIYPVGYYYRYVEFAVRCLL